MKRLLTTLIATALLVFGSSVIANDSNEFNLEQIFANYNAVPTAITTVVPTGFTTFFLWRFWW
jgi:hypothetical protein